MITFYKLGSDPELLFARQKDFSTVIIPANTIMGAPKEEALKSFIGTDAHPATAELRPPPSPNIWRHLYDLAVGLRDIDNFLKKRQRFQDVKLMALPWIEAEALGGHIHVSLFADEPTTKHVMDHNYVYHVGQLRPYNSSLASEFVDTEAGKFQEYAQAAACGHATTPEVVCRVLNHLTLPFENWIQPWVEREKRLFWCLNTHHVNADANYLVRWVHSPRPAINLTQAYMHVEYRTPSSWLLHPWLAYVYFALAKLTMLNYETARDITMGEPPIAISNIDGFAMNDRFKDVFETRLTAFQGHNLRITPDLADLGKAIKWCEESRESWFSNRSIGVDLAAWRMLLE